MVLWAVWSLPAIHYSRQIVLVLAIPGLALLALRGWAMRVRKDLPPWRNALGLASILITLFNLLMLLIFFLLAVLRLHPDIPGDTLLGAVSVLVLLSISLGFALRGTPRVQVILADLLMAALLYINVSF
jgi:uncharacterized membrane protein